MPETLASLEKGYRFPPASFDLSPDWVAEYISATEDTSAATLGEFVPPMALAALAIRALLSQSGLPPGAIHVAQDLAFARSVSVGEALTASAEVSSRGERAGWVLMSVGLRVEDGSGDPVMIGRATITFPAGAGA